MRRLYTLFIIASLSLAGAMAQDTSTGFVGDGYYRIHNYATKRYIYVTDNKDYYDKKRDSEDFQAIQLWKDASKTIYNPATVIYVKRFSNGTYDLQAQGTGVVALTGYRVHVSDRYSNGTYEVFAEKEGIAKKYLSDDRTNNAEQGKIGTTQGRDYRRWIADKIETNSATNYFGIKPTIELNGKYYQPFYAVFPFKTASPNMHVYYASKITGSEVTLKELVGVIPDSTAVIIECASANPSDNRLELLNPKSGATVKRNKLKGVYFCNGERPKESTDAYKIFDAESMRVFTKANDKLILTNNKEELMDYELLTTIETIDWETEDDIEIDCIPANTCYFMADADTPDVLTINFEGAGLDEIIADNKEDAIEGVYSLSGTQIRATNDVQGLPTGLYIVGGVKVAIK